MDGFKRPSPRRGEDLPLSSRPEGFVPKAETWQKQVDPTVSLPVASPYALPASARPDATEYIPDVDMQRNEAIPPKKRRGLRVLVVVLLSILLIVVVGAGALGWYVMELEPVTTDKNTKTVSLEVSAGDTWSSVSKTLADKRAIKSELAFSLYARFNKDGLPQVSCLVSPADSAREIIAQISGGCKNTAYTSIMFYPGATIETPLYKPVNAQIDAAAMSVKNVLKKAGYGDDEISAALSKTYSGELFQNKPVSTSLEGYVYGETYHISKQVGADEVLQTAFDQMLADLKKYDLINQFKQKQGLDLYQAITLASIVQRELSCEDKPTPERKDRCYQYQRSIAQVFLTRLKLGMTLGSDVTFIYAADQLKVQPSPTLDSPYNTRIHPGLPPGPIAAPGLLALLAVADATPTDYLFFIAGDDGLIYFAKTDAEHQANIKNHCQQLCSEL